MPTPTRHTHRYGPWENAPDNDRKVCRVRKCTVSGCDEKQVRYHEWGRWSSKDGTADQCGSRCKHCRRRELKPHQPASFPFAGLEITVCKECGRRLRISRR